MPAPPGSTSPTSASTKPCLPPIPSVSAISIHLVFNDDTSFEFYSDHPINFAGGLNIGDMERPRKYGIAPMGPMKNVLDISIDKA
jgi:hypothetical protein